MNKKSSITHFDFETIIEKNLYYVDKTLLIKEIEEGEQKVYLFPRPRRFGKTLNMMMLRRFFEKTEVSKKHLFDGLLIANEPKLMALQGQFPVIWLTFKGVKGQTWKIADSMLRALLSEEYNRHSYLTTSDKLDTDDKLYFKEITSQNKEFVNHLAIRNLCMFLQKHHGIKPYLFIDEYDTPINDSYINNYYSECITCFSELYSQALKDNPYIERAVITGIYRIAKESIFSGLNNLNVATILNEDFADKFGFTQTEVDKIIIDYGREADAETIKKWYNGYIFGENTVIYNPWSVLNYVDDKNRLPKPYWVNTSNNDIIKELITNGTTEIKQDIETLINGGAIKKIITEDVVFGNINIAKDALWSFFLFSGYLKLIHIEEVNGQRIGSFAIPNIELLTIIKESIDYWFVQSETSDKFDTVLHYLKAKRFDDFSNYFSDFITQVCSYYDFASKEPERVYHALVLGMMVNLQSEYRITSNRASGYGRYDIMLHPLKKELPAFIFEFKKFNKTSEKTIENTLDTALNQIKTLNYAATLQQEGFSDIHYIAIAFKGKKVKLLVEKA